MSGVKVRLSKPWMCSTGGAFSLEGDGRFRLHYDQIVSPTLSPHSVGRALPNHRRVSQGWVAAMGGVDALWLCVRLGKYVGGGWWLSLMFGRIRCSMYFGAVFFVFTCICCAVVTSLMF